MSVRFYFINIFASLVFILTIACASEQDNLYTDKYARHDFPYESKYVEILGSRIHYVESGKGRPILMVHGQPTWSYLWRNIIPHLEDSGRVIAVDLIGFGKSDQPDINYTIEDHARYLDAFIEELGLEDIVLVIHDWGSVLGQDYAARFPDNVVGIAMMEAGMNGDPDIRAVLMPFENDVIDENRALIGQILQPKVGERLIYEENAFIEQLMPRAVVEPLTEDEMNAYREPFAEGRSRLPMLMFPRELFDPATGGAPPYPAAAAERRTAYMRSTQMPILLLTFTPGGLIRAPEIAWAKQNIDNLTVHHIGPGMHYVQEDHPDAIGEAIAEWMGQNIK